MRKPSLTIDTVFSTPPPPLPDFLAEALPARRRSFEIPSGPDAGRRLHFIDHGPEGAPPVLLQHGNPTWCFLWRKVISQLDGFRSIAPDLLGLGLSDRLPAVADHTLARHADAITALVEALGLEPLILVGQDWGGPVVTGVGARLAEAGAVRIAGVVLANTAVIPPRHPRGTLFHRFSHLPVVSDWVFRGLGFPQNILHRVQGDRRSIRGEVARAYRWPLGRWGGESAWKNRTAPLALARMVPNRPDHPTLPELRRGHEWLRGFAGPMALVWGERDPILGRALSRHEREFPKARVTRTEAGHFLQEEVPEELAAAVRAVASSDP